MDFADIRCGVFGVYAMDNGFDHSGKDAAVTCLILGIISCLFFYLVIIPFICGLIGLIMARRAKKEGFVGSIRTVGFALSLSGFLFGVVILVVLIIYLLFVSSFFSSLPPAQIFIA